MYSVYIYIYIHMCIYIYIYHIYHIYHIYIYISMSPIQCERTTKVALVKVVS